MFLASLRGLVVRGPVLGGLPPRDGRAVATWRYAAGGQQSDYFPASRPS